MIKNLLRLQIACLLMFCFNGRYAQTFPNPATLSTGQGAPNTLDPVWLVSDWFNVYPSNTMTMNYSAAYISNNCAPGSWIDPTTLPPPVNNGNWISSSGMPCDGISNAYVAFRLTLNLPSNCSGNSLATPGNYTLSFDGYVDNSIVDVLINGVSENIPGLPGGSYSAGNQISFTLDGPWQPGVNYVDVVVNNNTGGGGNLNSTGDGDPYGLLLVANTTNSQNSDLDNDGVSDLNDLCPCDSGTNVYGCTDPPHPNNCDVDAIRAAFINAGCIELQNCANTCSMYFLNPQSQSGSAAQAFAQTLGANLISVQDAAENQCIIDNLNDLGESGVIWIGFSDEVSEGNFVWYDQAPVVYTNWAAGEPNNAGGDEGCVQIYPSGLWNDLNCNSGGAQSIIEVNLCPQITSEDVDVCPGGTAQLSASTLFGSPPYNYAWSNSLLGSSVSYVPAATETLTVGVVDRYNCTTNENVDVVVNPLPIVDFDVDTVCYGITSVFTNNTTIASGSVASYDWNFGDASGASNLQSPVYTYSTSGNYTVSLQATSDSGCVATQSETAVVKDKPIVVISDNNPLCDPSVLNWVSIDTYSATTMQGSVSSNISMTLTHSNGGLSTTTNMYNGAIFPAQYNVPLTGNIVRNDLSGLMTFCFNTPVLNPQIAISSIGNPGQSVQINTSEPYIVTWSGVDVTYPTDSTLVGTEGYTIITFPGEHTCISFDYLQSESYCNLAFGIQDTNCQVKPVICEGESVNLSASGALDYIWSPSTGLNTTTGANVVASPTVTTTYYAVDANDQGCSVADSVEIVVHPRPQASFAVDSVCFGEQNSFMDQSTITAGSIVDYEWNFGDNSPLETTSSTVHSYAAPGDYMSILTVTSNQSCVDSDTLVAHVYQLPVANYVLTDVCDENAYQFVDASTSAEGIISNWFWDFENDGTVDGTLQNESNLYPTFGAYDASLVVTTDVGCSDTIVQSVDVLELPTAWFSSLNVCEGTASQFTDLSSSPNGSLTSYEWDFENDNVVDNATANPSFVYSGFGLYDVVLNVTDQAGCSNDTMLTAIVNAVPVVDFTMDDVCFGEASPYSSLSTIGFGAITLYDWDFGDLTGVSSVNSGNYAYAASGTYPVTLTVTSDSGCVNSLTEDVEIWVKPTAGFAFQNVCDQQVAQFTNTGSANGSSFGNIGYDVYNNGVIDYNGFDAAHVYPSSGNYFVTQIVTTVEGCKDSLTQEIAVFDNPIPDFVAANACEDNLVSFANSSSINSGNILDFFWEFGDGNISHQSDPDNFYGNPSIYQVSLTATSDQGCVVTVTHPLEIYPTPVPNFLASNFCEGDNTSLVDFSSVSNPGTTNSIVSWTWDLGVTPTITTNGPAVNYIYPASGTYNVSLTVSTNHNCSETVTLPVQINPNPMVSFTSTDSAGCADLCVQFQENATISSGIITQYFWNLGNGDATTDPTASACYTNTSYVDQSYSITLTAESDQGCSATFSAPNYVTVYPIPKANFEPSSDTTNMYQTTIAFSDLSIIADEYFWDFSGLGTSTQESPSFTFPDQDSGTYQVCLYVASDQLCEDSICKNVVVKGFNNIYIPSAFTPNNDGTNDMFQPSIGGLSDLEFRFLIFDRWGNLMYESSDPENCVWDGTHKGVQVPLDVYVWKLRGMDKYNFERIDLRGHVSVLR